MGLVPVTRLLRLYRPTPTRGFADLRTGLRQLCSMAVASGEETRPTVKDGEERTKLHGRAFYESIGSPKYVVAPMVDQSEFVSLSRSPLNRHRWDT